MRRLLLAALAFAALAVPAGAAIGADNSAWPMMGGGQEQASTSTATGTKTPKISWTYNGGAANSRKFMGVVLGSDGTIYVGGHEKFYGLNPDGTLKFTANEQASGSDSFGHPAVGANSLVYISSPAAVFAYSTSGSGAVSFVSSAPVQSGANYGGGGAVDIDTNGYVYVSHGDDTSTPGASNSPNVVNEFAFTAALASPYSIGSNTFEDSTPNNYRSAISLFPDGTKACYLRAYGNDSTLSCFSTTSGALNAVNMDHTNSVKNSGLSFRNDGSYVVPFENSNSVCASQSTGFTGLGAYTSGGVNIWRNCDVDFASNNIYFRAPVSSNPANTFVYDENQGQIYDLDNSTGGIRWTYRPDSFGFSFVPSQARTSVSPLTLAAGTTLYFTYCPASPTSTRLVALNAVDGTRFWDTEVSSATCFSAQPVPGPGDRIFLNDGPEVIALEESGAAAFTASTSAPAEVGDFWYSTVTVAVTQTGGAAVSSGVPVEVSAFQTSPVISSPLITPSATGYLLTDTGGLASFPVQWMLPRFLTMDYMPGLVSTITFRSPGLHDQTVFLRETRPASVVMSSAPAALQGTQHVSTVTFTVLDAAGSPVPNVPCKLELAPPGSVQMTYTPNLTIVGFVATNGAGQASAVASDNLATLAKTSYATYASTIGAACLDQPLQHVVLNENRVASVAVSTGQATMRIDTNYTRVSTITVTLRDAGGSPVPNVPVALDESASPAPITITPFAANFTTATDASGQAHFLVEEFLNNVDPSLYAGFASTFTLHVLSFPDQSITLKEERVGSVSVSTGTAYVQGGMRVVVATVTVLDASGAPLPSIPVGLRPLNFGAVTAYSPSFFTTTVAKGPTNSLGVATFTITQDLVSNNFLSSYNFSQFAVFNASSVVSVPQQPDQTVGLRENRVASYAVAVSSTFVQPDIRVTTITVTVHDALNNPLSGIPVAISSYTRAGTVGFERLLMNFGLDGANNFAGTYTNAAGQATFTLSLTYVDTFDDYTDFPASITVVPLNLSASTTPFVVESDFLSDYSVTVATSSFVGEPFVSTVTALNSYGHRLAIYGESGVTLTPLFDGTNVQGSGALGTNTISFSNSGGQVVISSQTYNKIENIQIKATRGSGNIKTGLSGTLVMLGPVMYTVSVPTSAAAGGVFGATITAVDSGGNPVVGYGATLSVTPVVALATGTPASGSLTPATVNLPANGSVFVNNLSYNKGDSIQLKVADSGLGIVGFSSSMTITAPPLTIDHYHITAPASVTVGLPFNLDIEPQNASSAPVSYSLSRTLNIQAFLAGTSVAGSGSLGVPTLTLTGGTTYSFTASQTYNKIESVQLKVTDDDGRVGLSSYTITFTGPTQFVVTVPTAAQAGVPFQFVVQAEDAGNNQVLGYDGTVNVSAVDATTTSLAGGGILGVTSLTLAGGAGSSAFQTYTKAQGIRFRVSDSGIGVNSISSSMTVVAGPPASLTLGANPQSTIATVPSVLTAQAADAYNNPIPGSTATFTVASGSAVVTLGLVGGAVSGADGVVSTQAPTNVSGAATAFFGSTTTLFSQADLVVATLGGLTATTTIYNAVLITGAGGVVANEATPQLSVTCPAAAWAFNVRMSIAGKSELSAADLALTTAAFAASANTFVSTTVMKVDVVRDASPGTLAGASGKLVSVALPFAASGGNVTVGSFRGQSLLVPESVLRVFKLNKQTSIFEMVLDGVNLPQGNGVVSAQIADPEGIFALGAPPYVTLGGTSSGTVTAALAGGAMATVSVPFGAFAAPTTLTVSPVSGTSLPALSGGLNLTPTGIAISVNTNGIEPLNPVGVSLGYTAGTIAGLNPNLLRVARYDAGVGWKVLDSQVDTTAGTVVAQTDGFSIFELVAASPSSSVSSGFVYPNPFRPSLGHVNIKFGGLPAAAHIKVFTVSGRLLKELDADSTGSVLGWNGVDKDGRPLASGVYLAVVSDTTGGSGRATIKFAVQR